MKQDSRLVWEIEKSENVYRLDLPVNANLGEAYMAVGEYLDKILGLMNDHAARKKEAETPLQDEEQKPEEVKDECVQESVKDV